VTAVSRFFKIYTLSGIHSITLPLKEPFPLQGSGIISEKFAHISSNFGLSPQILRIYQLLLKYPPDYLPGFG
jgi:hypothetical protein